MLSSLICFFVLPQFHENWNKLMEWLDESEKSLDTDVEIANEPDKIKTQLLQHKVSRHPLTSLSLYKQLQSS